LIYKIGEGSSDPSPKTSGPESSDQSITGILEVAGTNRLTAVGNCAILSHLDHLDDFFVQGIVELTGHVAFLDGFFGFALADNHVDLGSSRKKVRFRVNDIASTEDGILTKNPGLVNGLLIAPPCGVSPFIWARWDTIASTDSFVKSKLEKMSHI
jgi:hypothetical protein